MSKIQGASRKREEASWKYPRYWAYGTKPKSKIVNKIAPFQKCLVCERDIISHPKLSIHLTPPFNKDCPFKFVI